MAQRREVADPEVPTLVGESGGFANPVAAPENGAPLGEIWPDGTNVQLGTSTGSKLGTDPGQKLGFWGAAPVVRPAALAVASAAPAGTAGAAYTAAEQTLINDLVAVVANLVTRVNQLESRLQSVGILP